MADDVQSYLNLVAGQHADKPDFIATLSTVLQPLVDSQTILESMPELFDLDTAVGVQLDTVGIWIGRARSVDEQITGVYFSFDTVGQGFDQAIWFSEGEDPDSIFELPDEQYRTLLRATIGQNHWNGTIPQAYDLLNSFFNPLGISVVIQDNQDMTMKVAIRAAVIDVVTAALFNDGFLDLRPAGVGITRLIVDNPVFTFGPLEPDTGGFDTGFFINAP